MTAGVTLLVIAKEPLPGRVKTRLCPPCTPVEAAEVAAAALADTLRAVSMTPATDRILVLDGTPGSWVPASFTVVPQGGGGLDARLAAAFARLDGRALLIGMDTPHVTPALLGRCAHDLDRPGTDAVLGRAYDGGWWGIGLRRPDPRVFLGVPMSTDHTGAHQQARLDDLGLRTRSLPELSDVDHFDDALRIATISPGPAFARCVARVDRAIAARTARGAVMSR